MTTETMTYEQLESRPPSRWVLTVCAVFVVAGLVADLLWVRELPLSFLMGTVLLSGIASAIFLGMAWTYRSVKQAAVILLLSSVVCFGVCGFNIYMLREMAMAV